MSFAVQMYLSALLASVLPSTSPQRTPPVTKIQSIYTTLPPPTTNTSIEGSIDTTCDLGFILRDDTGSVFVKNPAGIPCKAGDIVRLNGFVDHMRQSLPWYVVTNLLVIGHTNPPTPFHTEPREIIHGNHDFQVVTFDGVLTDVFPDELGPGYCWMLVEAHGAKVAVALKADADALAKMKALVDASVSVTGLAGPDNVFRRFLRPFVTLDSTADIKVITPPPADPFSAKPFQNSVSDQIGPIPQFAHRQRAVGRVIATWRDRFLFLQTEPRKQIRIRLASDVPAPTPGSSVTVAGFVRKDTFFAWMDNALVRVDSPTSELPTEAPRDIAPPRLLVNETGNVWINPTLNGMIVRIRGRVLEQSSVGCVDERFTIRCGDDLVPIETGRNGSPPIDAMVEVIGACAMETETEDANAVYHRIKGFSIVPRFPSDIRILAAPPWWTPAKLSALIAALLVVLATIVLRSKQKEQQTQRESQLRIDERTKLAVELHDSLAQNLTGISLQLDAAEMAEEEDRTAALTYLSNAREALRSCREGLRYCLSDLRSRSFEDTDMTEAVTETVRPHIGKTKLFVRFNVPRSLLSDSSAHAVLCIVRELAVNAVRHGRATEIHVAGEFRDGQIRFSVRDNGCGFDPDSRPGSVQGHFGLLGVNERVSAFKGTLKIDSAIGKGTKATVILNIS